MPPAERQRFLEAMLPDQVRAEIALHNGDVTPRLATWSHRDPVTCLGAAVPVRTGWPNVRATFEWVASGFVACDDYDLELIAADAAGRLAYTVGIERYRARKASGEEVRNTLRVTHVYRREGDGWRIVHRHGDAPPDDSMRA
jgi:ketosteroid isomerase-like protein